jgi:glucan-binding YG repeat protein
MKRVLAVFLMMAILLCGLTVTANAASPWKQDAAGKWTYTKADGTLATDEWIKDGGYWYYFVGTEMLADDVMNDNGKYYAFGKSGAMVANGWYELVIEDDYSWWVYAGADGALVRGWRQIGGKWYYFRGTQKLDEGAFPFMETGLRYFWDEEKGDFVPLFDNGVFYAFKQSGEMIVGWGQPYKRADNNSDIWVYGNKDGSLVVKNWKKIDGKWYYFDDTGWMFQNGPRATYDKNDPNMYLFDASGALVQNGWYQVRWRDDENGAIEWGSWYYGDANGVMKKGWIKDGGKWYYLDAEYGYMWSNGLFEMSDGKIYGLKANGEMAVGWWQYEDEWYYFSTSGAMVEKQWVQTAGKWYYLKEGGVMAKSETLTIDGKDYTFGADGAWVK